MYTQKKKNLRLWEHVEKRAYIYVLRSYFNGLQNSHN